MKRTKTIFNRIVVAVLTALLSIALLPGVKAEAISDLEDVSSSSIDLGRKGSLTVVHIDADDELAPGVTSHIYKVATCDAKSIYTITDEFSGFFEDQNFFNNGFNYDDWKSCVQHTNEGGSNTGALENYIDSNGISEVASGVSDSKGETLYDNLELGIYFVRSENMVKGDFTHSFINFVYPVPILEKTERGGNLKINYNPTASPKKSKAKNDVETHCGIRKLWNDSGYSANRPLSVVFEIYCDGELMETVTLSAENNWTYEWSNYGVHDYSVIEISAGEGYTGEIVIEQVGAHDYVYTCTNTYSPPDVPDNPPDTPENPPENPDNPPETPETPDTPEVLGAGLPGVLGAIRDLPAVLGARRLPQTGQLWWPLPILVIVGVVMIIKGIRKNKVNNA